MMRNLFFISVFSYISLFQTLNAQISVYPNGRVGIQYGAVAPNYSLAIATDTVSQAVLVNTKQLGVDVVRTGYAPSGTWTFGLYASNSAVNGSGAFTVGARATAIGNAGQNYGRGYGFLGIAGNTTSGYNYGVWGVLNGTQNGAGVVGTVNGQMSLAIPGYYAGYFNGDAVVTGTLKATVVPPSDIRLKTNVINLDYQTVSDKLMELRPVEYNMKQITESFDSINSNGETVNYTRSHYDETSQIFQKKHYGLIAQEVQNILPDVVYEGTDGYLGIDYTSLVPLLLKVVQQQQTEIEKLKQIIDVNQPYYAPRGETNRKAELLQNTPNPFSENTEIAFYLPDDVNNAMLCIYDMNGKQLSQTVITERGDAKMFINGKKYSAGMYLYGLIVDNQVIDTKRMILTK